MWMCDVMSSCYMLISHSQGVPPANRPPQNTLLLRLPLIYISLTERVVLQASPGIVRYIKRLVLARRKEVKERYAIDCSLKDRDKVFFDIRMRYQGRGSGGDRGG